MQDSGFGAAFSYCYENYQIADVLTSLHYSIVQNITSTTLTALELACTEIIECIQQQLAALGYIHIIT